MFWCLITRSAFYRQFGEHSSIPANFLFVL